MNIRKKFYLLTRFGRIKHRLEPHIQRNKKQKNKEALSKYAKFCKVYKRVKIYFLIRNISFILLYASVASAILSNIFVLEQISSTLANIGGLIGGTIFGVIILITNHLANLEIADAYVLASEIIAA
jgi:hypothetical protein